MPQSGSVLLGLDGAITIPPAVSAAVGQVFTDDRIADFLVTVSQGAPGMFGLQLSRNQQVFRISSLRVSSGQDVRVFSSAMGSTLAFTGGTSIAEAGSLTISGTVSLSDSAIVTVGLAGGRLSVQGSVTVGFPDGTDPVVSGELPGTLTAQLGQRTVGVTTRSRLDGAVSSTGWYLSPQDCFDGLSSAVGNVCVILNEGESLVRSELVIGNEQSIYIRSDRSLAAPPVYGTGGFVVQQFGALALEYLTLDTVITTNVGAAVLSLADCTVRFDEILVLRASVASFRGVLFLAGVQVPDASHVAIADSVLAFAAGIPMAVTVQSGGRLSLSRTVLSSEGDEGGMLHVDSGGSATVEGCQLLSAGGSDNPFPCDGELPLCSAAHAAAVELAGVAEVRTESPLVCDAETGRCDSVTCPVLMHPVSNSTEGFVYDNPGRTFGTTASCDNSARPFVPRTGWDRTWTCQIDGTWSGYFSAADMCGACGMCDCASTDDAVCAACCAFQGSCAATEAGLEPLIQWAQDNGGMTSSGNQASPTGGPVHTVCLSEDVPASLAPPPPPETWRNHEEVVPRSPTIRIAGGDRNGYTLDMTLDCNKAEAPCLMRHRLVLAYGAPPQWSSEAGSSFSLHRLHFADLFVHIGQETCSRGSSQPVGGAIYLYTGASLTAVSCIFSGNSDEPTGSLTGGAIYACGTAAATIVSCLFYENGGSAGAIGVAGARSQSAGIGDVDSGADLLLVSSVFDRNGWNIGTLRDGRDVNELQDAGAVQTQGMSSVNIDSCVFELNLANYQLHVGQTAGDPPSFTLVDSSFTTDFARRCEELSPAYADQTAECVAVFQCESHQNDCDWTWLQSLGLSKLDQWCCMHDLGTETTCTASGGRCIANVQGDSYVGDRHAMLWNHNSKAGLVCPGDDSRVTAMKGGKQLHSLENLCRLGSR